ncbi:hypothetical protein Tco_0224553, partial [Tanacetum coccineum]
MLHHTGISHSPWLAAPTKQVIWLSGSVEPSYIFRLVGIRWLGAENSMIRLVNGDFNTSLYGFLRSSSASSPGSFLLSFPLLLSPSSPKVRHMGVINALAFSLCCLMRVSRPVILNS